MEKDAISTPIIEHLIYEASENEFIVGVKKIYNEGKIKSFLEKLNSYANKEGKLRIPSDRASLVVGGLARLFHLFEVDERDFFSVPFSWQFLSCADLLFKCIEKSQCYPYICSIFTHPQVQPTTLALLLRDFEVQHGRFGEEAPENCEPAISLEEVLELEQIFKNRAIDVRTVRHGQPPPPVSSLFMKHTLLSYVRARGKDRSRVRQRKRTQEAVASGSVQSLRF